MKKNLKILLVAASILLFILLSIAVMLFTDFQGDLSDDRAVGSVVAWGRDNHGQVSNTPTGDIFVDIAVGELHNLALREDGSIAAWGSDKLGSVKDTPEGTGFIAIAAGARHSMALREDGTIEAWGWDLREEISSTPTKGGFKAISVGYTHSLGLHEDGTIAAWGWERLDAGQINDVPQGNNFIAINAGDFHNLAIMSAGK